MVLLTCGYFLLRFKRLHNNYVKHWSTIKKLWNKLYVMAYNQENCDNEYHYHNDKIFFIAEP